MVHILAVKLRGLSAAMLAVVLIGCSSGGSKTPTTLFLERFAERFRGDNDEAAKGPGGPKLTRALVEQSGGSLVYIRLPGDKGRTLMNAASVHDGYVTFISRFGQSVTMLGSRITGSRGLGFDLLSVATTADDPLVRPVPPANWPKRLTRSYTFPGEGPAGKTLRVKCGYAPGGETSVEIVERVHEGILMVEACQGDGVEFQNFHLADKTTGFVWKSQQWLGPRQGSIELEVIEPYTGD